MACLIHAFFYAKKVPAMAGTKMCGMDAFYASQSSLLLRVSQSSPKTVPKPQQERGFAVGEKRSKGKRISSKPLQGSLFVAFVVQRSGTHLPKEFTMILTVRNSFTIVNSPMVTLTAMHRRCFGRNRSRRNDRDCRNGRDCRCYSRGNAALHSAQLLSPPQ